MHYEKIRKLSAILVCGFILMLFTNCKKDEKNSSDDTTPVLTNKLSAIIDGKPFSTEGISKIHGFGYISVIGKVGTELLHVEFADTLKTGSYSLENDEIAFIDYSPDYYNSNTSYYSSSGSITFTEFPVNGTIKATFEGVLKRIMKGNSATINITNGLLEIH